MEITCISASNVKKARNNSVSTRTCEMVALMLQDNERRETPKVNILPLLEEKLRPCNMCGDCLESGFCQHDNSFNTIYKNMIQADGIVIVCPHYALIPSKLVMIFEKLQEIYFLHSCQDSKYRFPLQEKPVAVIVHGGQTSEALNYYKTALLQPLAVLVSSVGMQVVPGEPDWPGAAFCITGLSMPPDSIFVDIHHDWEDIRQRITPLVNNFKKTLQLS
jgi:multimeric flavodoxin WrbA